ncbi:MAG: 4-alpha-glucanotransferase [Chitinispirillales bacterium]|jgi:4-alpha-glucanotransferase|nr:4-alpha-glucanotransferase [Chitinispirillales bacterium]
MRASGIFLHPTSLPSPYGIGDLGESALAWIDLLSSNQQQFWQFCPLGPTGYGDSPYQTLCSFAGNTLLISPDELIKEGLLSKSDLKSYPKLSNEKVEFGPVITEKEKLLRKAFGKFTDTENFIDFCNKEDWWLADYALFRMIKELHNGRPWWEWKTHYKLRDAAALESAVSERKEELRYQKFIQFLFFSQWSKVRAYAAEKNILTIGDIPFYTAYDSSDTWAQPAQFLFDAEAKPISVAGVPPDYFSETGQLWGNPLYRWDTMRADDYAWWKSRIQQTLKLVDYIRIDHFRAFDSYWAIPASSPTAVDGEWKKGPGIHFFDTIKSALGELPFIAEDLGDITPGVTQLREQINAPGMKILQFAFDANPTNPYLPYNITKDSVTYTGTHDNDTSLGWFSQLAEPYKKLICDYLRCTEKNFMDAFLRCGLGSSSWLCIIPMQDVLELGEGHRMNTPGQMWGNWQWRMAKAMPVKKKMERFAQMTMIYGRAPGSGHCL